MPVRRSDIVRLINAVTDRVGKKESKTMWMAAARRYGFAAVLVAVLAIMGVSAAVKALGKSFDAGHASGGGGETAPVKVARAASRTFFDVIQAVGTAQANESVTLSSKVTDIVRDIPFESGRHVEKGQVLVRLAAVEEAANLEQMRAALVEAERTFKRYSELAGRGYAPKALLDQSEAARDKAKADVDASAARLSDHVIRAPFSGVVGMRKASPGLLATPGMVLATLDDTSRLKLDFDVPETSFARIKKGDTFDALSSAFPGRIFKGQIAEIDTRVSPDTRSVSVRAYLPNEDGELKPGMLMNVRLNLAARQSMSITEQALVENADSVDVFVVRDSGKGPMAFLTPVKIGFRGDGVAEILEGVSANDQIIIEGISRVRPKSKVRIIGSTSVEASAPSLKKLEP